MVAEIFSRPDDFLLGGGSCSGCKSFAFGKETLVLCLLYLTADEVAQSGHAKEDIGQSPFPAWPVFFVHTGPWQYLISAIHKESRFGSFLRHETGLQWACCNLPEAMMPIYDYQCHDCQKTFELVLTLGEHDKSEIRCPECGSRDIEQDAATFYAVTSKKS